MRCSTKASMEQSPDPHLYLFLFVSSSYRPERPTDVVGKPKGQGQTLETVLDRRRKEANKSRVSNHNRRSMADRKRNKGMIPSWTMWGFRVGKKPAGAVKKEILDVVYVLVQGFRIWRLLCCRCWKEGWKVVSDFFASFYQFAKQVAEMTESGASEATDILHFDPNDLLFYLINRKFPKWAKE